MNKMIARWMRSAPLIVGILLTTTLGSAAVYYIQKFITSPPPQPKKVVQTVQLIRPPPPPPIEKPPEPPKVEEEKIPEPEQPTPDTPADQPPAGDLLGLDAEGGAGGDAFGLIGKKGGRDLLASGGDRFAWYAGALKDDLLSFLSEHQDIRQRAYSVNVRLWLDGRGAVTRVALSSSTGDHDLDRELQKLLGSMQKVAQAPPTDMPQPVQIRIVSRL
jgi:periplasmic protein TonB